MSRKLASIQKIMNLRPIPGADLIEVADVLGWSVVVKKGDFAVGDLAVYYEIDSFLSASDSRYATFEERFINWGDKRGMRLKTIKLRKQLSQGLVLQVNKFPEIKNPQEGDDVTEILKIEKWESLSESHGNGGGMGAKTAGATAFPAFIRKTDQERVQNYTFEIAKHLGDEDFEATIKLDGSSMTVFHVAKGSEHYDYAIEDMENRALRKKGFFGKLIHKIKKKFNLIQTPAYLDGVCSRNIQLDTDGDNHFSAFVRENKILEALSSFGRNIAVQGELIAPTIQENYEKVDKFEFHVYDVFDIDTQKYLLPCEARDVAQKLGLSYVPVLAEGMRLSTFIKDQADVPLIEQRDPVALKRLVDAILDYAEGPGKNPGVKREGVVFKSNKTEFSFKAISNSYLLKKKD